MMGNRAYDIAYLKKGKPNGTRHIKVWSDSFEEALHVFVLPMLCEKVHGYDIWHHNLGEKDIMLLSENRFWVQYSVTFRNYEKQVIEEYMVTMELVAEWRKVKSNKGL